jgi:hypothetical protein
VRNSILSILLACILIPGCAYKSKPERYGDLSSLLDAMSKQNHTISSIKALASVSMRFNGRSAGFPEAIVIENDAMRLETLNIFYQPILIIVYNKSIAVLDTGTGACSISDSAETLVRFTHMDVPTDVFEKLITGRLPGSADGITGPGEGIVVSGKISGDAWTASVDRKLLVTATRIEKKDGVDVSCAYSDYADVDGATMPLRVMCRWADNRLNIHYERVRVNVPVDPSLMDAQKLCDYE